MIPNKQNKTIRVLLVDDSPLVLRMIERLLKAAPDIEIVGTARDGNEACKLVEQQRPDVICTDYHMPGMDGMELTRWVMANYPTPILVVSVSVQSGENDRKNIFNFLEAGAIEVFAKPRSGIESEYATRAELLIEKIRVLSGVHVFRRIEKYSPEHFRLSDEARELAGHRDLAMVAIGASTGGPMVLKEILQALPRDFPLPIVCVQHVGEDFLQGLVDWLGAGASLKIQVAQDGTEPRSGNVYFAKESHELLLGADGRLHVQPADPGLLHHPSIDITFRSMAQHFGSRVIAILLTGMGADGAQGLRELADAGSLTIAQDEESSVVFGMPKVAIELGAARHVLPPAAIIQKLREIVDIN